MAWWPFGSREKVIKRDVMPDATAALLFARFQEHLQVGLGRFNTEIGSEHELNAEQVEQLEEYLSTYFQHWFTKGFPALPRDKSFTPQSRFEAYLKKLREHRSRLERGE